MSNAALNTVSSLTGETTKVLFYYSFINGSATTDTLTVIVRDANENNDYKDID